MALLEAVKEIDTDGILSRCPSRLWTRDWMFAYMLDVKTRYS